MDRIENDFLKFEVCSEPDASRSTIDCGLVVPEATGATELMTIH